MTLRGPGPPPTLPDSPTLKSPRAQPTRIHKNQITINHKTATILCLEAVVYWLVNLFAIYLKRKSDVAHN